MSGQQDTRGDGYSLKGATLEIEMELGNDNIRNLSRACEELLKVEGDMLYVDLRRVKMLVSTNIGIFGDVHFRALEQGRRLRILVPPSLMRPFEITGMTELLDLEMVSAAHGEG